MNTCMQCQRFSFREAGELAQLGFGWCPNKNEPMPDGKRSRSIVMSSRRQACEEFEAAEMHDVMKRITWLKGKQNARERVAL